MRGCRGYTHVLKTTCLARDQHNYNTIIISIFIFNIINNLKDFFNKFIFIIINNIIFINNI